MQSRKTAVNPMGFERRWGMGIRSAKFFCCVFAALLCLLILRNVSAKHQSAVEKPLVTASNENPLFGPSNPRTENGQLIPVTQFFSAARCLNCHQNTRAASSPKF